MELPFDDDAFDVVCCQFGMMFMPNKTTACREASRVLRDGGRFVFNVWDRIEDNEFAQSVAATAARFIPDGPPAFLRRTPHGYHDADAIRMNLRNAGFANVVMQTIAAQSRADSAEVPALAYYHGTPLRHERTGKSCGRFAGKDHESGRGAIARSFGAGPVSGKIGTRLRRVEVNRERPSSA